LKKPFDDKTANEPFVLIGTDQGLLPNPIRVDRFHTSPAERWEFVFDFSPYDINQQLVMVNLLVDPNDEKLFPLMAFNVRRVEADASRVPPVLRGAEHPADVQGAAAERFFRFAKDNGPYWSINGQIFDARRDDARPVLNTNEDWILDNPSGGWGHPVHIHLGRFRVLDVSGRAPRPGELEGFKDVVWLGPNQRIKVRHQFWNFTDRFVFHCHNGSHEDFDMMSQFNVQPNP
jgi:FtsP/CotA-like multicopper oxidase with cupredoxin domain